MWYLSPCRILYRNSHSFKCRLKWFLPEPSELGKPYFSDATEVLNAIDVTVATREFILSVVDSVMPHVAPIHQSVIALPVIAVDGAVGFDLGLDNLFEGVSGHIGTTWA